MTKRDEGRRMLENMIETDLHPGDPIPSERALVERWSMSRVTVRQAIGDLVEAGALERIQGKGTFVRSPQIDSRLHLTSFSREMRARGLDPSTNVVSAGEQPADADVAAALHIAAGSPVIRVERLRLADGSPIAHEIGYYPSALFPGLLDRELDTLYDVFAHDYGVRITSAEQTVRADLADGPVAEMLTLAKRSPLLITERTTFAGRRAIEVSWTSYRADRYRLHMALTPRGPRAR